MQYKAGDIVFASEAVKTEKDGQAGEIKNHLYVIIDDDGNIVPADYFGFVVSSRTEKSKENSNYKYNEMLYKNSKNNLITDSIVKCDQLLQIGSNYINKKIGCVEEEELNTFLNAFEDFLDNNEKGN